MTITLKRETDINGYVTKHQWISAGFVGRPGIGSQRRVGTRLAADARLFVSSATAAADRHCQSLLAADAIRRRRRRRLRRRRCAATWQRQDLLGGGVVGAARGSGSARHRTGGPPQLRPPGRRRRRSGISPALLGHGTRGPSLGVGFSGRAHAGAHGNGYFYF